MSELQAMPIQTIAKAELDMQITTAKAYPRTIDKFVDNVIKIATMDDDTAESCIYSLKRTDKEGKQTFIKGESIRLAEIALGLWGNMHAGTRIIANDGKKITAEGVAWDLENNVRVVKQCDRSIFSDRTKKTYSQDMQVVTGNAAASIALRNSILSVIPRALVRRAYQEIVSYLIGDKRKLIERTKKLIDRFKIMGIEESIILDYFNRKNISDLTQDEVEEMIGIGTAIKEGTTLIEDAFIHDKGVDTSKANDLNSKLDANNGIKPQSNEEFLKELDGK